MADFFRVFFIEAFMTYGFTCLFYLGWRKASKEVDEAIRERKNREEI